MERRKFIQNSGLLTAGIYHAPLKAIAGPFVQSPLLHGISKDEVGAKWQHVGIFCFNIGHSAGIPKLNIYKK